MPFASEYCDEEYEADPKKKNFVTKMKPVSEIIRMPKGKLHLPLVKRVEKERDKISQLRSFLMPLEKTVVNTSTQKDYDLLMQVYEIEGWEDDVGKLPTTRNYWNKEEICVSVGIDFVSGRKRFFGYAHKNFYQAERWKIISLQEFYNLQNISPEMINEINEWFEKYKSNRASKGE